MSYSITINAETPEELQRHLQCLLGNVPASQGTGQPAAAAAPAAEPEKPKRTRKAKAKAEEPAKTEEAPAEETPAEEPPVEEGKALTIDDVKAAMKKVQNAKGVPATIALLALYDAKSASGVPEDKYAEFITAAEEAAG